MFADLEIIVSTQVLSDQTVVDTVSLETGGKDDGDWKINILVFEQTFTKEHLDRELINHLLPWLLPNHDLQPGEDLLVHHQLLLVHGDSLK